MSETKTSTDSQIGDLLRQIASEKGIAPLRMSLPPVVDGDGGGKRRTDVVDGDSGRVHREG